MKINSKYILLFCFLVIILFTACQELKKPLPPPGFYPTSGPNSLIPKIGTNIYEWPPFPPTV